MTNRFNHARNDEPSMPTHAKYNDSRDTCHLKIVIIVSEFHPSIGGMQILAEMLARQFSLIGHDVFVVTNTPAATPDSFPFTVARCRHFQAIFSLCKTADVVLAVGFSLKMMIPSLIARRPVVVHHPNPIASKTGALRLRDRLKLRLTRGTTNIVPSSFMASVLPNSIVIPNPYNDRLFQYHGEAKPKDLVFVGRLARVKGVDTLLNALREFSTRNPISLTIVGDGPERASLESLSRQLGLSSQVTFVGSKHGEDLASTIREHKVMVVPSLYKEPFGIVALEGLASGCLLIVSRDGGLLDATGTHALAFENGNSASLAHCLATAFGDDPGNMRMLQDVRKHLARHSEATIAERYLVVMKGALAARVDAQ